jgi:hypothetical protein
MAKPACAVGVREVNGGSANPIRSHAPAPSWRRPGAACSADEASHEGRQMRIIADPCSVVAVTAAPWLRRKARQRRLEEPSRHLSLGAIRRLRWGLGMLG